MAWKSNWKRIFWNKFHFKKEQRRRKKNQGNERTGKAWGSDFFLIFFFIVEWQKKFTQWQLYKLNGGINYKMKLNDCTRKSDTFISLFGTRIRCTLQHVLFFCVPRVFFFARLFSHSFTHSSEIVECLKSGPHQLTHRLEFSFFKPISHLFSIRNDRINEQTSEYEI